MTDKVSSLLPAVAEVTRHRHYRQHLSLLETVLHKLPLIARGLGKRTFKRHLELFLDSIFYGRCTCHVRCPLPVTPVQLMTPSWYWQKCILCTGGFHIDI